MSIIDRVANNVAHMGNDYSRGHTCGTTERQRSRVALVALSVIMLLCAFVCLPSRAYAVQASGGVIWGPDYLPGGDGGQRAAVVNANNKYVAAALALGYSAAEISGWSDDVLAKLSNESTGGSFYQYAQTFSQFSYDGGGPVGAIVEALGNAFFAIAESLYGNAIWISVYDEDLGLNAALDLKTIVEGGNVGGGGGGSGGGNDVGTYQLQWSDSGVTLNKNRYYTLGDVTYYPNACVVSGQTIQRNVGPVVFELTNSNVKNVLQDSTLSVYIWGIDATSSNGSASRNLYILITDDVPTVETLQGSYNGSSWTYQRYTFTYNASKRYYYRNAANPSYSDGKLVYSNDVPLNTSFGTITANIPSNGNGTNFPYYMGSAGGGEPVVPPTNWPDEPSAPSPPELPEPGTDVPVDPTPWSPFISLPDFDFDINVTTEPTTNDLIDWVKKIYYELKAFHMDAHSWFADISMGFDGVIKAINHTCSQLYSQLLVVDNTLRNEGLKLRNYLYQMFHWLAGQFDFRNDPFNDSNIVYWLRRIWSKLGNGDINLRPTDPTNDPESWWDWLIRAIQNFLIGLAAGTNDLISEIADLVSQVMHQFPFSIPWDIAAILAALTAAPITPEFTITIPAVQHWWSSFDIVIDLEPFDTAAETIRLMEKLLFTGYLVWKSKDLLDFMDVSKWFDG